MAFYLPNYTDEVNSEGNRQFCLISSSLETATGGQQVARYGDTLTFRYKLKAGGATDAMCHNQMDAVSCSWATSCTINGQPATKLNTTQIQNDLYRPSTINQRDPGSVWKRDLVSADGEYEVVFTLRDGPLTANQRSFTTPTTTAGPYVGVHRYPNGGGAWAQMIPFNIDPVVLEHKELDKIRLDLGFSWPNPFGDSSCLVCDASTAWRWVKRTFTPASLGYGWDTMGHNVSLEEDAETNSANPGYKDIILHDGTGSFDRWKYDSVSETYSHVTRTTTRP